MKAFDWQRMALDKVPVEFPGGGGVAQPLYLLFWSLFSCIAGRRGAADVSCSRC